MGASESTNQSSNLHRVTIPRPSRCNGPFIAPNHSPETQPVSTAIGPSLWPIRQRHGPKRTNMLPVLRLSEKSHLIHISDCKWRKTNEIHSLVDKALLRRCKLAQFMSDHVLGHVHGYILLPVMYHEPDPKSGRQHRRSHKSSTIAFGYPKKSKC
jgi:hypothetical protein